MIILDTNILVGTSLRGLEADVLRAIKAAGGERVAVPWIVLEEIAAQQALAYARKHDAAVEAMETLRKATPWVDVPHPRKWPAEHVRKHWRTRYTELAEVIETSPTAYQDAMFREANLIAPCKAVNSGKNKTGSRDAAIWLTAVEYARKNRQETVYFVSNNTEDFGDGTSFPEPMDKDIAGMEDRFFVFTSLDGVLTKFATELTASTRDIQALLDTDEAHSTILNSVKMASRRYRMFHGTRVGDSEELRVGGFARWAPEAVALDKVQQVSGREIDGHKWFTASVRWLLTERSRQREGETVAYAWETRILLSPTADKGLTVLDSKRPGPISPEDVTNLPELPESFEAEEVAIWVDAMMSSTPFERRLKLRELRNHLAHGAMPPDLSPVEAALFRHNRSGRETGYIQLMEALRHAEIAEDREPE
ncbi:PIN domain-containing protein [Streptomyces sp. NPDC012421]|uniref:PIN domain-containing protein n=1 Tax=Streptomyces sp. NPDC012421 TaxID=3364832 RepID=UPI0036ED98B8